MQFRVALEGHASVFACRAGESVLRALNEAGSAAVPVGCRSGGCGVCRVQVVEGSYDCGTMSGAQIDETDRARGVVLACQLYPRSDLHLRALGRRDTSSNQSTAELLRRLAAQAAPARAA